MRAGVTASACASLSADVSSTLLLQLRHAEDSTGRREAVVSRSGHKVSLWETKSLRSRLAERQKLVLMFRSGSAATRDISDSFAFNVTLRNVSG